MEKRKDAAGYQHQCFTMMVLLNVIIVLFLTFTIVLTQYRVAAAQEAQKFIGTLKVMPERPEQRIIMVIFSLFFLCGIIYYKRQREGFTVECVRDYLSYFCIERVRYVL